MSYVRFRDSSRQRLITSLTWCIVVFYSLLLLSACRSSDDTPVPSTILNEQTAPKVMTPNWGIAATLTAMGYPPIAMGEKYIYGQWVGKPIMPAATYDVGMRYQPNPEMFSQLGLDVVIDSPFYEHLRPMYGDLPVYSVSLDSTQKVAHWNDYARPTLNLGKYIGQPDAAQEYLDNQKHQLKKAGQDFRARHPKIKKLAVVQFADTNNLRMYSYNSLFEPALSEMGLELIALDDGNQWGFTPIMLGDLSELNDDTCLVVVEPLSNPLKLALKDSLVWQRLGYSFDKHNNPIGEERCLTLLPATWINGGIASMSVLAERLKNANFVGNNDL
ncbi:ABC transporter substrate-binding protein [uncultured Psychrobacter sp.]|uniref:ABC transporter substrate-binding protein n=1 Tax=uncultured Psychrobacter sp. TaxID=259303 RepID=UPI0026305367|nr:ABC transporter substrate-binding protein [uncultured Psychrobacter sp.]